MAKPYAIIERCFDYRVLLGKRDHLGLDLEPLERELLADLERFLGEQAHDRPEGRPIYASRDHRRLPTRLAVEYSSGAVQIRGLLCNLSGGGAHVETPSPLAVGELSTLRVQDFASGREWRFSVEVAWCRAARGMGLRFVGIPLEMCAHSRRQRSRLLNRAA